MKYIFIMVSRAWSKKKLCSRKGFVLLSLYYLIQDLRLTFAHANPNNQIKANFNIWKFLRTFTSLVHTA